MLTNGKLKGRSKKIRTCKLNCCICIVRHVLYILATHIYQNSNLFQVSLLFEVGDLSVASPATVSRCGMVYFDYTDLGYKPFVASWLAKKSSKVLLFFVYYFSVLVQLDMLHFSVITKFLLRSNYILCK